MPENEQTGGYYFWVVDSLQEMIAPEDCAILTIDENNEIDQIRKMVDEITDEPPQFLTTT